MKRITLILLITIAISTSYGYAENSTENEGCPTPSSDTIILYHKGHQSPQRSLINHPVVSIQNNTLYFIGDIPSCTLQLLGEYGNMFYETYIPEGTECWELPTDQLAGCELRLIIGDDCYYCVL